MTRPTLLFATAALMLTACNATVPGSKADNGGTASGAAAGQAVASDGKPFAITEVASFKEPWAMSFIPGRNLMLVSEKGGALKLFDIDSRQIATVSGTPRVDYGGQGGLGDIIVSPGFDNSANRTVYLSWAEAGDGDMRGAVVARADLAIGEQDSLSASLQNLKIIWRQNPKVTGRGHYSHRMAFSPDGKYLFISSGDRQKMDPAQDKASDLGKIIRFTLPDGPAEQWSMGHRNTLGLAFDAAGNLWNDEMGPAGGDEVNLILQGKNYGWPRASNGSHYDGKEIPDHAAGDGFEAPKVWWTPSISPSSLMIYSGDLFPAWKGDAFIGALSGKALIRVDLDGTSAKKGDQWDMGTRIREVEQGPDGAIWLLEDGQGGTNGRLLKLTPPAR